MRTYNLQNGLQAIKDAWFYKENILIMPWAYDLILVANDKEEKEDEEGILEFKYRTYPDNKIYVKSSDFSNADDYLNCLEERINIMAEKLSDDPKERKRKIGYLHLTQLAFAIRERITLDELYATDEEIEIAEQKVEDYLLTCDAVDRIYCDYHTDKDLTFEDHIVLNFTGGDLDEDYHFCDEDCAKRFILSGVLKEYTTI